MSRTVSFDFDGVLHKSIIPGTLDPLFWTEWRMMQPFHKVHRLVRQHAENGDTVICVTARPQMEGVWEFIAHYGLPITDVVFTGGKGKADFLLERDVVVHYDDHPRLQNEMRSTKVTVKTVYPLEDRIDR